MSLSQSEIKIQHGFKSIVVDINSEKNKTLEAILKKYKDNLFISVPLNTLLITESNSNDSIDITDEVINQSFYIINLKHDAKGMH